MIDGVEIKGVGIETANAPLEHLLMFLMRGIVDRFEELEVSRATSNVFRWTCISAGQTQWQAQFRIRRQDLFDLHAMLPVVAVVIDVGKRLQRAQRPDQGNSGFVQHRRIAREVWIQNAVIGVAEREFMEVDPRPSPWSTAIHRSVSDARLTPAPGSVGRSPVSDTAVQRVTGKHEPVNRRCAGRVCLFKPSRRSVMHASCSPCIGRHGSNSSIRLMG
ncbi:hypothetical protein P3T23_001315 [Paraburkholderia sp. GAS448]